MGICLKESMNLSVGIGAVIVIQLTFAAMQRGEPMEDLISRQSAIDAIHCDITITGRQNAELVAETIGAFADRIKALPSAQPKRGLWIDDGSELGCQCSQCGKTLDEYINCGTEYMTLTEIPKFCPNCCADMRGEQDDKQRSD